MDTGQACPTYSSDRSWLVLDSRTQAHRSHWRAQLKSTWEYAGPFDGNLRCWEKDNMTRRLWDRLTCMVIAYRSSTFNKNCPTLVWQMKYLLLDLAVNKCFITLMTFFRDPYLCTPTSPIFIDCNTVSTSSIKKALDNRTRHCCQQLSSCLT